VLGGVLGGVLGDAAAPNADIIDEEHIHSIKIEPPTMMGVDIFY
jgi:hypothetical protein